MVGVFFIRPAVRKQAFTAVLKKKPLSRFVFRLWSWAGGVTRLSLRDFAREPGLGNPSTQTNSNEFFYYVHFIPESKLSVCRSHNKKSRCRGIGLGCGAGRVRTAVQTRNQNVFYMLILLLIVGSRPAAGSLSEP